MKKPILSLALLAGLMLLPSQAMGQSGQEELIEKRDKKLASKFLSNGEWILDYDEALKTAKQSGKMVFGYFTRSYSP